MAGEATMELERWGPLAGLIGEWQGDDGVDVARSHATGRAIETRYRERASMVPFGPVVNGSQVLYGVDYRSTMWRTADDGQFHTEVGYWLWDAQAGEVLRAFVVPRGISLVAGGTAEPDATTFTMSAHQGEGPYRIAENLHLARHASTTSYEVTIDVHGHGSWSYDSTTTLRFDDVEEPFAHTDSGVLRRVADERRGP